MEEKNIIVDRGIPLGSDSSHGIPNYYGGEFWTGGGSGGTNSGGVKAGTGHGGWGLYENPITGTSSGFHSSLSRQQISMMVVISEETLGILEMVEAEKQEKLANVHQHTATEINAALANTPSAGSELENVKARKNAIDSLIQKKREEIHHNTALGEQVLGRNPLASQSIAYKTFYYNRPWTSPEQAFENLKAYENAYRAIKSVEILEQSTSILSSVSAELGVKQQEAERALEKQAQQQASSSAKAAADAAARRRAEEFQRQAEAEARDAAEASEAERARKDAEAYVKHAADAGRLWSAVAGPNAPTQSLPKGWDKASKVAKGMLMRKAATALGRHLPVIAALYPSEIAESGQPVQIFTTPASELGITADVDLPFIASKKGTIDVNHRLMSVPDAEDGRLEWRKTDGISVGSQVRVRPAVFDPNTNTYNFTRDGESTPSLTWTPQHLPGDSSTAFPSVSPDTSAYVGGETPPASFDPYSNPEHALEPDDYVVELPVELGLENPYIYFKNPRNIPGIASGSGQPITGSWLGEKTREEGAPIPSQIAALLRGQKFTNFDKFREAFWESIANDAELGSQLSNSNLAQAKRGKAPYPKKSDQVGGRDKFEIHHKDEVAKGGAVYDMDNMVIMTPAQHIQHHKETRNEF